MAAKIKGGSFGISGSCRVTEEGVEILGDKNSIYKVGSVIDVISDSAKIKKFGFTGFIIGAVLLGWIGFVVLNIFGAILGLVIAWAGSQYSESTYSSTIKFADGKHVVVDCSKGELNQFVKLNS